MDENDIPPPLPPLITSAFHLSEEDREAFLRQHITLELHGRTVYLPKNTGKDIIERIKQASAEELGLD